MKQMRQFLLGATALLLTGMSPVNAWSSSKEMKVKGAELQGQGWTDFHSVGGKCTLKFPLAPQHISEKMSVAKEGYDLKYDAYVCNLEKKNIYMLLIAQYPDFVDQSLAQISLEGFLNGILGNNPSNQLLFADLLLVEGHQALDFFIRTGGIYFKGRAVMVKNHLYLMAMECEVQNYDEGRYNYFVGSFKLHK